MPLALHLRDIIHLDADAFFASVEQSADPRLRGKPVAVGGEKRGIIASASYEARKFGIYTPMPTVMARRLCTTKKNGASKKNTGASKKNAPAH